MSSRIKKIVLTGGPCAGKTTAMIHLQNALQSQGYYVYKVPETSTLIVENGAKYPGLDESKQTELFLFELHLIKIQIAIENCMLGIAEASQKSNVVLLCDRGCLDIAAYMPAFIWNRVLNEINETQESLLERYDCVCHLVTAANGASEYYTLENNTARTETIAEAKDVDNKIIQSWSQHPYHFIVDNSENFSNKLNKMTSIVLNYIPIV